MEKVNVLIGIYTINSSLLFNSNVELFHDEPKKLDIYLVFAV